MMKKGIKYRKWVFLWLGIAAVFAAAVFGKGLSGRREEKPSFEVTVRAAEYVGQGVVYRQQGDRLYIVTAGHVLDALADGEGCRVAFGGKEEWEAKVLYRSETADVAFLEVHMDSSVTGLQAVPVSREHFDSLAGGDGLWAVSSAGGSVERIEGELIYFWVYLEDFSLDMMLAKMDCRAGMSGCAIVEENGYFVGILCGVSKTRESAILPYSIIESEWIQMEGRGILK
ncbi:MAG: trypsin-like peptidase domain-containing protein [Lachnospiraceae bacterium]|nr:trypsin-like peptidase domain-containing protein [Lachnospiraceae bacterium]MBD5512404.1 trypsin-like peptidase domain-containing protein [Lachnospiraceae bacterium]